MNRIQFKLEEFETEHKELRDVVKSVQVLQGLLAEGRQEFLQAARTIGADVYGALLGKTREVWKKSEDRYGQGPGYKQDVAGYWREFFEEGEDAQNDARRAVDRRLQKAWEQHVLSRLKDGTRAVTEESSI